MEKMVIVDVICRHPDNNSKKFFDLITQNIKNQLLVKIHLLYVKILIC